MMSNFIKCKGMGLKMQKRIICTNPDMAFFTMAKQNAGAWTAKTA
jgi:hypothetical protein